MNPSVEGPITSEDLALVREIRYRLLAEPDPLEGQPLIRFRPPNPTALPLALRRAEQEQRQAKKERGRQRGEQRARKKESDLQRRNREAVEWLRRHDEKERRRRDGAAS